MPLKVLVRTAALAAAVVATLGVGPDLSPAGGGFGIGVTPGRIDVQISPGTISSVPVMVNNPSDAPVHIVVTAGQFTINDDNTYTYGPPSGQGNALGSWLAVRPREFDIAPGSFQQVQVSLVVPSRRLSGEYAGVLLFQTRPGRAEARRGVAMALAERYADKVYATVAGTGTRDGRVEHVIADAQGNKEHYRVTFLNTGTVHEFLSGSIQVLRNGSVVQTIALPKGTIVERGGERNIEVTGSRLAPAAYDIVAIVDYGGNERTGGKFHLEAGR